MSDRLINLLHCLILGLKKGFFRRTIQKNVTYACEWSNACTVDRETRTQCQKCRFDKCLAVGMTPHTVLSERQRVVKRQIREENRIHRAFNELAAAAAAAVDGAAGDPRATQPAAAAFHSVLEIVALFYLIMGFLMRFFKDLVEMKFLPVLMDFIEVFLGFLN